MIMTPMPSSGVNILVLRELLNFNILKVKKIRNEFLNEQDRHR